MKKLIWINKLLFIGLLVTPFILSKTILASNCSIPSPCEAFSRAETVFIGKLQKVLEDKNGTEKIIYAYFEVERVFKGTIEKNIEVKFSFTRDCKSTFIVGEKYFVYKNNLNYINQFNRTHLFNEDSSDFIYANTLLESKPVFSITGKIQGLTGDEISKVKVIIEGGKNTNLLSVDSEGTFNHIATKQGSYNIKISLPFDAKIWVTSGNIGYDVQTYNSNNQTTISYDLEFNPNGCDSRNIWFSKDYKISKSKISGKVVDELGNPMPQFVVSLYPNTPNQNFTDWDFRLARTNETGEYIFDKLKPGSYVLGINMGRTPDFDIPYPETYFPGKKTLNETQIINLTEKQDINLAAFIIPPNLKTVKISGKLVWEDGTPVTKFSPDSSQEQKPRIYLIDPITLKSNLGSLIGADDQGNFTFLAFEGYSYILHADAINSEKAPMHSKHILIKATENVSPITLNLSVKGEGKSTEEIKNELGVK